MINTNKCRSCDAEYEVKDQDFDEFVCAKCSDNKLLDAFAVAEGRLAKEEYIKRWEKTLNLSELPYVDSSHIHTPKIDKME